MSIGFVTSLVVSMWWTCQTDVLLPEGQYWDMFELGFDHSGDLSDDALVETF